MKTLSPIIFLLSFRLIMTLTEAEELSRAIRGDGSGRASPEICFKSCEDDGGDWEPDWLHTNTFKDV